ncbi:chemotaxis protein CheA [Arsukibacterium sp.]|uniref:chemotaxis protein CheA n=1 Tax=Arsukibacterium sp. TaxID=1977258 RepID=UPI003567266B
MNMDQALQTFIAEANELLQDMESLLLQLENNPEDTDTLGAIFRAAHTVKGSAGLFGLDLIVSFAHVVEDVLDRLRAGEIAVSRDLVALLLECFDHLQYLVEVVAVQSNEPDANAKVRETALRQRLQLYRSTPLATVANQSIDKMADENPGHFDLWHISVRFGPEVFRNGMDPLAFLRYLNNLGSIKRITTLFDGMPELTQLDPESCYLGFEIDYQSDASKATIAETFEFVRDDCQLHILPPHSKTEQFIDMIKSLPEETSLLGELLVASGAITQQELDSALQLQENAPLASVAAPIGEILVEQRAIEPELVQAALDKQNQIKDSKSKESRFVRVDAEKLDELITLVGELVIAGAGAGLLANASKDEALQEAASTVSALVEAIRDGALRLRMVPIGDTFNRFQRVVRDVSNELGKSIELKISGADTELDKTVIEKIGDPLMHLLRNAMDHGIEAPAIRAAAGKSGTGVLRLNAFHDSGSIVIEITDDGAGLNRDRILQKAIERGLVSTDAQLSKQEINNLIFEPGFSTADTVTNLSGRGVGMDVVKRNITALRGTVDLQSEPGQGTTVSIRLPLTLAIIDGFLIGVSQASYVVPLDMVQECIELPDKEQRSSEISQYINLRGEVLPLIFLREYFSAGGSAGRRQNVVVVKTATQKAGLVVDELQGEFQTVIKPLGKLFSKLHSISGSTILGSGEVALILDVPALIHQLTGSQSQIQNHPQARLDVKPLPILRH